MTDPRRSPFLAVGAVVAVAVLAVAVVAVRVLKDDPEPVTGRLDAALANSRPAVAPFEGLTEIGLLVDGECSRVVVADENAETYSGLRGIPDPGPYRGMLFVYTRPKTSSFTMSGVTFPLELTFYDEQGRPFNRHHLEPCPDSISDCPGYPSVKEFLYALETYDGDVPVGQLGGCSL